MKSAILKKDYKSAIETCSQAPQSPEYSVFLTAITQLENGIEAMRSSLTSRMLQINDESNKKSPFIAFVASSATLVGLLGTIYGLIKTFTAVSYADPVKKAELLGVGISEAMNSTAAGLVLGISATAVYVVCSSRADRIMNRVQDAAHRVVSWIEEAERV